MRIAGNDITRQAAAKLIELAAKELGQVMAATTAQGAQAAAPGPGVSSWECQPAPQTPMGHAQSFLAQEGQRLEESKYNFSPEAQAKVDKMNTERDAKNAKAQKALNDLDQKRAAIEANPSLSPSQKAKELKKLDKVRSLIQKQIKPRIDLANATRSVDQVMNDPNLSAKEKKKKCDELRKELGLSKKEMHKLVTDPLSKAYKASQKRVEAEGKAQTKALEQQIKSAEQRYGKNSSQVQALKAQKDAVGKVYSDTAKQLGDTSKQLHKMFKPKGLFGAIGSFFASVGKVIGKVLDVAMPFISMIPGVGQIAGAVWAGVKAVTAAVKGDWGGMLSSLAGAIPGVGKMVGGAAQKVLTTVGKVVNYANKGLNVVKDVARGDIMGALMNGASLVGGAAGGKAAKVLTDGAKAVGVAQQVAAGNIAGALSQASGFLGDGKAAQVLSDGAKAVGVVQNVAAGNFAGALSQASGLLGDVGETKAATVLAHGATAAGAVQQAASGNVLGALSQASVFFPDRTRDTVQRTVGMVNDSEDAFRRLSHFDLGGASSALNRAADEAPSFLRPALSKAAHVTTRADAFESKVERALRGLL